jgi:hypothetical protein
VSENEASSDELASVDSAQSLSDPEGSDEATDYSNEVNNSVSNHADTTCSGTGSLHSDGNEDDGDRNISGDHEDEDFFVFPPERRLAKR